MSSARDVILDLYAAFGRGDVPAVLARVAPDAQWGYEPPSPWVEQLIPWFRRGTGRDAAVGYFTGVAQTMEFHHFEPMLVAGEGDRVLAQIRLDATIRTTGKRLTTTEVHAFRVRDGMIVEYSPVVDGYAFVNAFSPG